jgi:hypothetical protein
MAGPFDGANVLVYVNMAETVQATLTVGTTNSAFKVTAVELGTAGNSITLTVVVPSGAAVAGPTVSVSGTAITLTTGTAAAGVSNTTANQAISAINANAAAKLLVTASLPATSNGTGTVAAAASANLTGGAAAGAANFQPVSRQQGTDLDDSMDTIDANSKGDRFALTIAGRQSGSFELPCIRSYEDDTQERIRRGYARREEFLARIVEPASVTGTTASIREALVQATGFSVSYPDSDVATVSIPFAMKENWRTV